MFMCIIAYFFFSILLWLTYKNQLKFDFYLAWYFLLLIIFDCPILDSTKLDFDKITLATLLWFFHTSNYMKTKKMFSQIELLVILLMTYVIEWWKKYNSNVQNYLERVFIKKERLYNKAFSLVKSGKASGARRTRPEF